VAIRARKRSSGSRNSGVNSASKSSVSNTFCTCDLIVARHPEFAILFGKWHQCLHRVNGKPAAIVEGLRILGAEQRRRNAEL
jgi:hypothetical protein